MTALGPIPARELGARFRRILEERTGTQHRPDALTAWRAYRALAREPVVAGDAAAEVDEDLLMFDFSTGGEFPPMLRLVRRVGLANEKHDYIGAAVFECRLGYDEHPDIEALEVGAMTKSFSPERGVAEVDAFLDTVERSGAFRALVLERAPTVLDSSP